MPSSDGSSFDAALEATFLRPGLTRYEEIWELQRTLLSQLVEGSGPERVIACQHHSVITIGKSGKAENVLVSSAELHARGIKLLQVERGGDVTYHGPGQLVVYPIIDLKRRKKDVSWYMRSLEEVIIKTLKEHRIGGSRVPGKAGVWIQGPENTGNCPQRKIAALGVRLSRWCTMHGFSLNVESRCQAGFSLIRPCGFSDIQVTSMESEAGRKFSIKEVETMVLRKFYEVFL